jgi:Luciferase
LHYVHPKSGWVTCYIREEQDIEPIIELFRLNYTRPWLKRST